MFRRTRAAIGVCLAICLVFLAVKFSELGAVVADALIVNDYRVPATAAIVLTILMLWKVCDVFTTGEPPLTSARSQFAFVGALCYFVLFASVWYSTGTFTALSRLEQLLLILMSILAAFHGVLLIAGACGVLVHETLRARLAAMHRVSDRTR